MISAVSQRLKLTAENSITTISKLVGKAPVRSKIERNTTPRKKEKRKQFSQGYKSRFFFFKKKKEAQIERNIYRKQFSNPIIQ